MEETTAELVIQKSESPQKDEEDKVIEIEENKEHLEETENTKLENEGSEYESVNSASGSVDNNSIRDEEEHDNESCSLENEGSVTLEREEGDGQESLPSRKVDDDEDKKNPQYIPKKGTFYEHDDRTLEEEDETEELGDKNEKQSKRNIWIEKKEKWSHDRFDDKQQAPKSRAELVAIYGYDIRNEDGPPKARRRRRYGRGPNKYTRTWEDEDAYKPLKPNKLNSKKTKPKNHSEYPLLGESENIESNEAVQHDNLECNDSIDGQQHQSDNVSKEEAPIKNQVNNRSQQMRSGLRRNSKPRVDGKKEIQDSSYTGMTKTRQYRNSKFEQKILPKSQSQDVRELEKHSNRQNLDKEFNKLNIQDETPLSGNKQLSQRQASVPPRLQSEQKGSKRYSSLRQRSLPETVTPTFTQQTNFYANEFNQPSQSTQPQQGLLSQHTTQIAPIPPPQLSSISQPVPATATSILQTPQFAPPFPPAPQAFLQPAVAPTFLPQQPPQIINYVQGQPQFPQGSPFQGYQHQAFNTVTQPTELYQCQGGTTYYSTQGQQLGQRTVHLKRPKAAIPIVPPPPPQESRSATRISQGSSAVAHDICERINNENNGNFDEAVFINQ